MAKQNIKKILLGLNLKEKEAELYIACLQANPSTVTTLAKRARVQRTEVYSIADKLVQKGLFQRSQKDGKTSFFAVPPDTLVEIEKQRLYSLEQALPELKSFDNSDASKKPKILYFEGENAIEQINADTLKHTGEVLAFTTPNFVNKDNGQWSKEYIKKRVDLGNKARVIGESSTELLNLKKRDSQELRETKILPQDIFKSNIEIGMYDNKTFICDYKNNFGFIIEGEEISNVLKKIFNIVWNNKL